MKTLRSSAVQVLPSHRSQPRRSLLGLFAAAAGSGWLTACAGLFSKAPPPPPKPGTLSINVAAASNTNPNANNRPSPVVVRLYELKAVALFEAADFLSLYEKDQSVLGADIVVRDEFVLLPGDTRVTNKPLAADTKFIGVVAAFRELERARWRAVVAVQPNKNNLVAIHLDGISVRAAVTAT